MGIDESITLNNVLLYPNPTNNIVNLINIPEDTTIKVFNSMGKLVYSTQANQHTTISTVDFANGIYFVQLTANNQPKTVKKLLINR